MNNIIAFESLGNAPMCHRIFLKGIAEAQLLLASDHNVQELDVLDGQRLRMNEEQKKARATSTELLQRMGGEFFSDQPVLTISTRNVLANLRCWAYTQRKGILTTMEESAMPSVRSYFGLGYTRDGRFEMREEDGDSRKLQDRYEWFLSGVPLRWIPLSDHELLECILSEAADPSHIFRLPRGKHPEKTDTSEAAWESLRNTFVSMKNESRKSVATRVSTMATQLGLERERTYLHQVIGVDPDGNLCQIGDRDTLEALGQRLYETFGCERAICFDNGGSCAISFYPAGVVGPCMTKAEFNHRSPGTAYLAIRLVSNNFRC
ncbi:MAG: hypothetical protein HQL73_11700 [Magnetococcales bacterium]|nr:hypothetical protein [Magnetococcales bacterium]